MKKKDTVFDYVNSIFVIYGFVILCMCLFCVLLGDAAKDYSTLFALGSQGLTVNTMLEFFLLAALIATLKFVLFADGKIKNVPLAARVVIMFGAVIVIMVFFVVWFGWFPINIWEAWVSFLVSFLICAIVSAVLSSVKERYENKKLEEALAQLKKGMPEENKKHI